MKSPQINNEDNHLLNKPFSFSKLITYQENSIVSKTIMDQAEGTITLFAFDKGQQLSEHTAPFHALVQIIEGQAKIKIAENFFDLKAGQSIIMPANIPHAVSAQDQFKMLLTMIRSK